MSTTLVCYGDSNTYGFDSRSFLGGRYPRHIRWTGIIEERTGWKIQNFGVNGRSIPYADCQINFVCEQIEKWAKTSQSVYLWIMLGTNDLLKNESFRAEQVTERMKRFLGKITMTPAVVNKQIAITLIAPPAMQYGAWVDEERVYSESRRMGSLYQQLAVEFNIAFVDMGQVELPVVFDGVHLSEEGHRKFAEEMMRKKKMWQIQVEDNGKVDLHMHTNISDGSDSALELWEKVKAAGLTTFSVTDHDAIDGALEMEQYVTENVHYIRGIEFTCTTDVRKCHILGYDYDPGNQKFRDAVVKSASMRKNKLERRIPFLEEKYEMKFTKEEIQHLKSLKSAGKPQIAEIFVKRGMAENIWKAIPKYLQGIPECLLQAEEAIQAIRNAHGTAVWAHPLGGEGEVHLTQEQVEEQLEVLILAGIQGMECYYSRYTEEEIAMLKDIAKSHQLMITGGSDYHGEVKKGISLGVLHA